MYVMYSTYRLIWVEVFCRLIKNWEKDIYDTKKEMTRKKNEFDKCMPYYVGEIVTHY